MIEIRILRIINIFIPVILILSAICTVQTGLEQEIAAADLSNLETVLEIFKDSRMTRDLKESNNVADKQSFMDTLEREVYHPVDQKVIEELSQLPEYEGKRIITHDFRTPGADGVNVNTDRDVRVLVEVELDRWEEVPTSKWEDTYYREFARRTNYRAGIDLDSIDQAELKKHVGRYRQLPTDKFHIEASRDFSDVDTVRVYGSPEHYSLVSTPNIVRAKKGLNSLKDPEGLAYMYREKADEQFREAREIEVDIKKRVEDGIPLSTPERVYVEDLKSMHEIEGTVQLKKGIETLEDLRGSYQKMGYDTGQLSAKMLEAAEVVKGVDGTSKTDIAGVKSKLNKLGFAGLEDLNQKVSSQLESLKIAKKNQKPRSKSPDLSLNTAGKWAGIAGDLLSIKDALARSEQGNHLLFNFEKDDSKAEKTLKALAAAALELSPVPVIDALERGWQVDEEEKEYLKKMNIEGRAGSWETHPLTSLARVSTRITYQTVKSMTIDPLLAGKTAITEGYQAAHDISSNFLADFERSESARLQADRMKDFQERAGEFGLGIILGEKENGRSLENGVKVGEILNFYTSKTDRWTDDYRVRWELELEPGNFVIIKEERSDTVDAENLSFTVPLLEPGNYTIWLRIFDRQTNLQIDYRETKFTVSDEIGFTDIRAAKEDFIGEVLDRQAEIGDILAFKVDRIGSWNERYYVEWLVNGQRYKYKKAADPKIHLLRFTTDDLQAGLTNVAVRILDNKNKIIAHRAYNFNLIDSGKIRLNEFSLRGAHDGYDGPKINRPVENGEILAFTAEIKHPVFREEITPITRLIWQVYDSRDNPLTGLGKVMDVVENGENRRYHFRFRADNLPNGDYYVRLQQSIPARGIKNQADYPFKVYQPVRISRVLVTDNKERQEDRQYLFIDQNPFFYVYYDLAENQKVNIRLTAHKNGSLLENVTVERPRKGEAPPYRIGLALPETIFADGDIVDFAVEINDQNGYRKASHKRVEFVSYQLKIIVPDSLRSGEENLFEIKVPANFQRPFRVEVKVGKGLGVGYHPGELTGTITGIVTGKAQRVAFSARVTDAAGITAEEIKEIMVEPRKASAGTKGLNKQLVDAVKDGDVNKVKELLEKGASPNSAYYDSNTVLHYDYYNMCSIANYLKIVRELLEYGGDPNRLAEYGSPLYYITDYTYSMSGIDPVKIKRKQQIVTEIVKHFIEYGADVNLKKPGEHSALWMAAVNYNLAVVNILLNQGAVYEMNLLEWLRDNSLDRAKTAAGKMVAGAYNYETEAFVLQQFNEIERILKNHYGK